MRLPTGKVGPKELERYVFPYLRIRDQSILLGPGTGLDAAAVAYGSRILVLSSDPITGALENLGWLSVNINANDVAVLGAKPRWFLCTIFLPRGFSGNQLGELVKKIQGACDELKVSLVGGHTEVTPGISRVVISGTMIGETPRKRLVTPNGAKAGDCILLTKTAAIEGTGILAWDREKEIKKTLGKKTVEKAKKFIRKISVVKEALIAAGLGANSMHDPTEGGILGGLHELADASNVGFEIESVKIPLEPETKLICDYFNLDPLKLISSGALLITAPSRKYEKIIESLKKVGVKCSKIGHILENPKKRLLDGNPTKLPKQDELWRVFKG